MGPLADWVLLFFLHLFASLYLHGKGVLLVGEDGGHRTATQMKVFTTLDTRCGKMRKMGASGSIPALAVLLRLSFFFCFALPYHMVIPAWPILFACDGLI